jgi:hypothetical protein
MYLHLIREAKSKGKGGRSGCKPFCTAVVANFDKSMGEICHIGLH